MNKKNTGLELGVVGGPREILDVVRIGPRKTQEKTKWSMQFMHDNLKKDPTLLLRKTHNN